MDLKFVRRLLLVTFIFVVVAARPAQAQQAPLEAAQLPSRTTFYLIWRGAPASDVRKVNSLLSLWDDPDFAPVRSALAAGLPKELGEFASLLENSFTFGYLSEPSMRRVASSAASPAVRLPFWNGMFLVYNRSGKEALLSKAILRLQTAEKDAPRLSEIAIAGTQVLKVERKSGITYWAEHGKYAVSASEASVMEDLLGRLDGNSGAVASLARSAAYQEAQPLLGSGLLEFFLRVPDLKNLTNDSNAGWFQVRPLLDAARLDTVHSLSGHVTFEGTKTHLQAAILGDAAPGTLFDIWSSGQPSPASLSLVPADAVSFTFAQLNLRGIYDMVNRVARAAFPQGPQGNAELIDTTVQSRLGMPLRDALGLFTGEFASMQTSPSLDTTKQVLFFGIHKKLETLKLFRAIFGDQLSSERNEGDVTFLKISLGGNQGSAGVAQWHFFHLAVTPDIVLGASRIDTLREVLANRAKGSAARGLASVPQFQLSRTQSPENLNGLSYFDFQRIDWQAAKDRWLEEAKKSSVAKSASGSNLSAPSKTPDWLTNANAQVLSRHLHYSYSVAWKDAKGIHWDQWVE